MKSIKIFILLLLSVIFVKCTESVETTGADMEFIKSAKYLVEDLTSRDNSYYYGCTTFADSAMVEAQIIANLYNMRYDGLEFTPDDYLNVLNTVQAELIRDNNAHITYLIVINGIVTLLFISLILLLFSDNKMRLNLINSIKLIGVITLLIGATSLSSYTIHKHLSKYNTSEELKMLTKEAAIYRYFTHNSS